MAAAGDRPTKYRIAEAAIAYGHAYRRWKAAWMAEAQRWDYPLTGSEAIDALTDEHRQLLELILEYEDGTTQEATS